MKYQKIIFLDADKTLWKLISKRKDDWVSFFKNPTLVLEKKETVIRKEDGVKFVLKDEVKECLAKLKKSGVGIGLISDNEYEDVMKVVDFMGIKGFLEEKLINIRLWVGSVDKALMVSEVLGKLGKNKPSTVLVVDDKDYSKQMAKSGFSFLRSPKDSFPKATILEFFGIKQK